MRKNESCPVAVSFLYCNPWRLQTVLRSFALLASGILFISHCVLSHLVHMSEIETSAAFFVWIHKDLSQTAITKGALYLDTCSKCFAIAEPEILDVA